MTKKETQNLDPYFELSEDVSKQFSEKLDDLYAFCEKHGISMCCFGARENHKDKYCWFFGRVILGQRTPLDVHVASMIANAIINDHSGEYLRLFGPLAASLACNEED